jgi:transposase
MADNELQKRIEAIRCVAQGEPISAVCADLDRSRTWYYKWQRRFDQAGVAGLVDRRHQNQPGNETPEWLQHLIVDIRDRLVKQAEADEGVQGVGARVVRDELQHLQIDPPHWTTIHRILRRAGRIPAPDDVPQGYCPRPDVDGLNAVHQVDVWPQVIHGGPYVYFFHLVDVASWYPHGSVSADKSTDTALAFLVDAWQTVGVPQVVQFDNAMTFTGGRWAHRLGRVVRLCMAVGATVWFIPYDTPERNGYVEALHHECERLFWTRHRFDNIDGVQATYPEFLDAFRRQRRLPAIDHHTPTEWRAECAETAAQCLRGDFSLHRRERLPIVAGTIMCARLADHQGSMTVLNHDIELGRAHANTYVLARVEVAEQCMTIFHQPTEQAEPERIKKVPFPIDEPICDFDPTLTYPDVGS